MSESAIKRVMKNAEASINMEGLRVLDYSKELCAKLLRNEISLDEYIKLSVLRAKNNAV